MTSRSPWLKPAECARRMGHKDPATIIAAIRRGELDALERTITGKRIRYLIHVDEFERWFGATWKPIRRKAM